MPEIVISDVIPRNALGLELYCYQTYSNFYIKELTKVVNC